MHFFVMSNELARQAVVPHLQGEGLETSLDVFEEIPRLRSE